jgi:hypothetical protein
MSGAVGSVLGALLVAATMLVGARDLRSVMRHGRASR